MFNALEVIFFPMHIFLSMLQPDRSENLASQLNKNDAFIHFELRRPDVETLTAMGLEQWRGVVAVAACWGGGEEGWGGRERGWGNMSQTQRT